jgi:hypothetical protein
VGVAERSQRVTLWGRSYAQPFGKIDRKLLVSEGFVSTQIKITMSCNAFIS